MQGTNQYMQPPVVVGNQMNPESTARGGRRRKRLDVDAGMQGRAAAGAKPYQVRVKPGGEIAGGCDGKNSWDSQIRMLVPRILDMSILEWKGQSPNAVVELRGRLDSEFEYMEYNLTDQGFIHAVKRFMKGERSRLKRQYREGHEACPMHIDENQWERLIKYWTSDDQREKSLKMSKARESVKAVSTVGRKGKNGMEEAEVYCSNPIQG
jgi:hypothetical protein